MVDQSLAEVSNLAIVVAIVLYVLALVGFAGDLASSTQRRSDARLRSEHIEAPAAKHPVVVSAGGAPAEGIPSRTPGGSALTITAPSRDAPRSMSSQKFAFFIAGAGTLVHVAGVGLRAAATQRVPWANMYEFAITSAALVMLLFLIFSITRRELRLLGTFVVGAILLLMFLAQTFWLVPAAALTPSLQNSHWLVIHIGVAILSTALSILGALVASLQLIQARDEKSRADRSASGAEHIEHRGRTGVILDRLPESGVLETLSFRVHSVAFVCWTFTLICGSIWAREAWGRFWGWDPKEVWTFVIWVLYAAYLHARATGGFRGNRAAALALAGFVAVVFNYTIVNTVINGLHSYSGL